MFAKSLLLVCLFIMAISAVARFFGILWFQADLSAIQEPSHLVQQAIFVVLSVFELTFTHKILCKIGWNWCFLFAILQTFVVGFFDGLTANLLDIAFIVGLPLVYNYTDWKTSLRDNILFYILVLCYSATLLFGRVGIVYEAKMNFAVQILTIIDYKILFVALYLVVKLYGGIKLWKGQKKPFFKMKDQST